MKLIVVGREQVDLKIPPRPAEQLVRDIKDNLINIRSTGRVLEVTPDSGETLRGIKLAAQKASKQVGLSIRTASNEDETSVLIWLADEKPTKIRRTSKKTNEIVVLDVEQLKVDVVEEEPPRKRKPRTIRAVK